MVYAPLLQSQKGNFSVGCVLWRRRLRCSAIFGDPVLPVRARSLMHTILSTPLHPYFGSYPPGWVTHTHNWHEYICHSFFGPCACAQSTAALACIVCGSTKVHACVFVCRHASVDCVLCLLLCIGDKWGKERVVPVRERRNEESCASEVASLVMPRPSCTLLLLALLAPIPKPRAPASVSGQGFVRCLPSLLNTADLCLHTLELSGATWPDTDFFPIHDINIIWFIVSIQANSSLEGSLKRANQLGTVLACYILEIYRYIPLYANADPHIYSKCLEKRGRSGIMSPLSWRTGRTSTRWRASTATITLKLVLPAPGSTYCTLIQLVEL